MTTDFGTWMARVQARMESALERLVAAEPVLVRISAAKRLRDEAESSARGSGSEVVTLDHLRRLARDNPVLQES